MTTKTVSGTYASGYEINLTGGGSGITTLSISASGYVEGSGVFTKGSASSYTIGNLGRIDVAAGRYAINLADGGAVTNGSGPATSTLIEGGSGVVIRGQTGLVTNFGSILAGEAFGKYGGNGVFMATGTVTNGGVFDTGATISGDQDGVKIAGAGSVMNFGEILGVSYTAAGVSLVGAGTISNGSMSDTKALIEGGYGVIATATATILNDGTILGLSLSPGSAGIDLNSGAIDNGNSHDVDALIKGHDGLLAQEGNATVANFGTIVGIGYGVRLFDGGSVTNGGASDEDATIEGDVGIAAGSNSGAIVNFGTVLGLSLDGISLPDGGMFINGSASDKTALIQGYIGANLYGASGFNFGTVVGDGATGLGARITRSALTNGAVNDSSATLQGHYGASLYQNSTLTNFGTVVGGVGVTAYQGVFDDTIIAEAGSVFDGAISMGGGALDVVSGVATTTGVVSYGAITGAGTLALSGGTSVFSAGISLAISEVEVLAGATVEVATNLSFAGTWAQGGGTTQIDTGDKLTFTGAGDSFSGSVNGAGSLLFSGGYDSFGNLALSAKSQAITNAQVTLSGAVTLGTNLTVTTPTLLVAASGATLSGAGELILSNTATNSLYGVCGSATLIDDGKILGAGDLGAGQLTLIIGSGGLVDGDSTLNLTIDTGANTIHNAGEIESVGAGGVTIAGAVANAGKLFVNGGTFTLDGAVAGVGTGLITKGTLFAASTFTENVTFNGTAGILELAHAQTYTGTITGFSKTGTTSLDLGDITFASGTTKATYSGTTTSGTLTVTDGTHSARITLSGNYTASAFITSSDGHGGTTVVDPTPKKAPHAFIAAMAGFGEGVGAGPSGLGFGPEVSLSPALAAPVGFQRA